MNTDTQIDNLVTLKRRESEQQSIQDGIAAKIQTLQERIDALEGWVMSANALLLEAVSITPSSIAGLGKGIERALQAIENATDEMHKLQNQWEGAEGR